MTRFIPISGCPESVEWLMKERRESLILVSRHGLGDNIFFSPCFEPLRANFERLYFCSSVNAYTSIFHESEFVVPLYAGGINGASLRLADSEEFASHFDRVGLEIDEPEAFVYHFGLFDPPQPYSDPTGFVKGRRNILELNLPAPGATEVPRYHVAPDSVSKSMVETVLDRWLPDRDLIIIVRYGHTDAGKNFGDDNRAVLATIDLVDRVFPRRFKYLSFDYFPGEGAPDGHRPNVRSVYGFLPCDSGAMHHAMSKAKLLVTVPTGPMLVGATIPHLRLLTLWKEAKPWHFLDPQGERETWAVVEKDGDANTAFMSGWNEEEREAVEARWKIVRGSVTPETVAGCMIRIFKGE